MTRPVGRDTADVVRLVAAREFTQTVRSKQFIVATIVTALIAAMAYLLNAPEVSSPSEEQKTVAVVTTGDPRPVLPVVDDLPIRWHAVPDQDAALADVSAGRTDAALLPTQVVAGPTVTAPLAALLETERGARAAFASSDPAEVSAARTLSRAGTVPVQTVSRSDSGPASVIVGYVVGFLIYYSITLIGQSVARSVVEERSTRTVEILLSTVRSWQLLAGKVVGLTLAGLVQVVTLVVGVGAALIWTRGSSLLAFAPGPGAAALCLAWLVVAVSAFGMVFAGVGATVDRQADLQSVLLPILLGLAVVFFGGVAWFSAAPGDPVFQAVSLLPPMSIIVVPARLAAGSIPAWQTAIAFMLLAAAGAVMTVISARLFRGAVLQFNGPPLAWQLLRVFRQG